SDVHRPGRKHCRQSPQVRTDDADVGRETVSQRLIVVACSSQQAERIGVSVGIEESFELADRTSGRLTEPGNKGLASPRCCCREVNKSDLRLGPRLPDQPDGGLIQRDGGVVKEALVNMADLLD